MKNIVLAGGSFNPPHKAHKKIVEILCNKFEVVVIVPCGIRPDKVSANIIPIEDRMKMVNLAFSDLNVIIDLYDFVNKVYTPTYLIQERYEKQYPGFKIWHVIGEDIIAGGCNGMSEIHRVWDKGTKIWNDLNFIVIVRPGFNAQPEDLPPHSRILEIGDVIGSGTLVRKRIADNRPISDLVEPDIDKYIKDNCLYRSDKMVKQKITSEVDILIEDFKNVKNKIYEFKYPEELFEELEGNTVDEKVDSLKKKFRALMFVYGVDRYNHYNCQELFDILNEITRKIIEFENQAEQAILNGTYGEKRNVNGFILNGKFEYQINSLESQSDFFETFLGTYKNDKNGIDHICLKAARATDENGELLHSSEIDSNNELINREISTLKHLDSITDKSFQKVRMQHFPILIDALTAPSGYVDMERNALVTKIVPGSYDFVSLRNKFPNGIPLYHGCWILARMLSAAGHLHYQKRIHGNIHPEGIFVNPQDHNVTMADLEFSVEYTAQNAKYIGITEDYTAPEIYNGAKPHPRTDMFSIGMSMIYLLGGDVKKRKLPAKFEMIDIVNQDEEKRIRGINGIRELILSLTNQHPLARSDDAWHAYHQLSELRKLAFGKPQFIKFNL